MVLSEASASPTQPMTKEYEQYILGSDCARPTRFQSTASSFSTSMPILSLGSMRGAAAVMESESPGAHATHAAGRCKPCIFSYNGLCSLDATDCEHCHGKHSGNQVRRLHPSKRTRTYLRHLLAMADSCQPSTAK